jgi:hypothetical protein
LTDTLQGRQNWPWFSDRSEALDIHLALTAPCVCRGQSLDCGADSALCMRRNKPIHWAISVWTDDSASIVSAGKTLAAMLGIASVKGTARNPEGCSFFRLAQWMLKNHGKALPETLKFLIFFCGTRIWTQGLMLARKVLYHLSHLCSPLLDLVVFQIGSHIFAQGWPWTLILLAMWEVHKYEPWTIMASLSKWGLTNFPHLPLLHPPRDGLKL